jgi:glutamate-1-semialdehyde 2,1-aminomutase
MTGFRLALGGAQERYGIQPDMTCLGKILGGGLPCGAFGGRADIMRLLAPLGPVYQAGTLSGNPLAMAAGIATVETLIEHQDTIYPQLERVSAAVVDGVAKIAREAGLPVTTNRVGSMFTLFFTGDAVTDYDSASRSNTDQFAAFHRAMLEAGVWLPPSQFEAAFLGITHGEQEIHTTLAAAKDAIAAAKSA